MTRVATELRNPGTTLFRVGQVIGAVLSPFFSMAIMLSLIPKLTST